jgi:hypothetical protein
MIANVSPRSAPATLTVEYDDDVDAGVEVLLAVLKHPARGPASVENEAERPADDEAA